MAEPQYTLKTVDRAFELLRIVTDAPVPLSLSEIAARADINTSNAFRFLKTLEASGHVVRDAGKRYAAVRGGGREIGLAQAIDLLDLIAAAPGGGAGAEDLAAALGLDVPQIDRALAKLATASVVAYDAVDGLWRLSTAMMRFFRPLLNDQFLARFVRPVMRDLSLTSKETVSWFVPHGWEQVVVEVLPSPHPIRYVLEVGARQPGYLGAAGKAHLATLDPVAVKDFLADLEPVQLTRFALDKAALLAELDAIRARGFATSDSERVEGAGAVAVAVRGPDRRVMGVISVMMPTFRIPAEDMEAMGNLLKTRVAAVFDQDNLDPSQGRGVA